MLSLAALLLIPMQSLANVWKDSFGQQWFYEVRSVPGEVLAGTWKESSLTQGSTYHISFNVNSIRGRVGLYVGDSPMISIDTVGAKSYDFSVAAGGNQHMIFTTLSNNVAVSVSKISVTERAASTSGGAGDAPGHYVAFSRERDLKTEMLDVLARPQSASSGYQWNTANGLDDALTTPGVKGFQVTVDWRTIETGDGVFNWQLMDNNMVVARRYGLKFVVKILDRSFDGTNIMPLYFPSNYLVWTTGSGTAGYVSKRWEPYVYTRMIRLYKAIANRYSADAAFGGIATTESALGNFSDASYTLAKYETAMTQIVTQTEGALTNGRLFWYLNFVRGDNSLDLNKDPRVIMTGQVPHASLVIGGPDVTPDVQGMPGSVNSYRIYVRKNMPTVPQFCHMQHVDLGLGGRNVKDNTYRQWYIDQVAAARLRESKPTFNGTPAAFEFDTLDPTGATLVKLHPSSQLGADWQPRELFNFGQANFSCDYVFWNYREPINMSASQFYWPDVRPVIIDTQYFYN